MHGASAPASVLALVVLVALSGCTRPLASSAEPVRASSHIDQEIDGAPLWLNGTMKVSLLPDDVAAVVSPDTPHNCFLVDSTKDDAASFLGGVILDLQWDAVSASMTELNVTVTGYGGREWSLQGPSPLHLVIVADDSSAIRTPFPVRVAPVGTAIPIPEQSVSYAVDVGVLESDLGGLDWHACSTTELPVP